MYVNEKLKLNKFRKVQIPENRDYFSRYGFLNSPESSYSGEESAPGSLTKIEEIELGEKYAKMMAEEQAKKEE